MRDRRAGSALITGDSVLDVEHSKILKPAVEGACRRFFLWHGDL
jgi:hypothetical protein